MSFGAWTGTSWGASIATSTDLLHWTDLVTSPIDTGKIIMFGPNFGTNKRVYVGEISTGLIKTGLLNLPEYRLNRIAKASAPTGTTYEHSYLHLGDEKSNSIVSDD